MAAAAGAPGSGEGGEAEPDSEPISGDDRPRQEHAQASALHGGMLQEHSLEKALDSMEAEPGEAGLRLPETEGIGPEVTRWESEVDAPSVASEASPEAWPPRWDGEASVVVTGDGLMGDDLSSQEAMQLEKDCNCPPAPCHGELAPEEECMGNPSKDCYSSPAPCHGERTPGEVEEECMVTPSKDCYSPPAPCHGEPTPREVEEECIVTPSMDCYFPPAPCHGEPTPEEVEEECIVTPSKKCNSSPAPCHGEPALEEVEEECIVTPSKECNSPPAPSHEEPALEDVEEECMVTPSKDCYSPLAPCHEEPALEDVEEECMVTLSKDCYSPLAPCHGEPALEEVEEECIVTPSKDCYSPLAHCHGEPAPEEVEEECMVTPSKDCYSPLAPCHGEPAPEEVEEECMVTPSKDCYSPLAPCHGEPAPEEVEEECMVTPSKDCYSPPAPCHGEPALEEVEEECMVTPSKDCNCPPAPCHGEPAQEEVEEECMVTPSKDTVHPLHTSSPQHQVMLQCGPEPVRVLPPPEVLQEIFHESFALMQDSSELETLRGPETTPLDHVSDPLKLVRASNTVSPAQECNVTEVADGQDAHLRMETEVSREQQPLPVFSPLQEPMSQEIAEQEGQITPSMGNLDEESVSETGLSEVVAADMQVETPSRIIEEVVLEEEVVPESAVQEPRMEGDNECVPEPFHRGDDEELICESELVENNKGTHSDSVPCTEIGVAVKLSFQPVLTNLDEGSDSSDIRIVSLERECQSDNSSPGGQASVRLIMSEDVDSLSKQALEDAVSPMDSGICSELTSVEKELDSQSGPVETEPTVDVSSERSKLASYCQDVDYDPFYRDTKTEDSTNTEDNVQEEREASTPPTDIVQTKDLAELSMLPTAMADVEACTDNPNPCQDHVSTAERLVMGGIDDLIPGSEVQVTLDHIIQDALVVSFRHGDRIFSGVLMDLSKRFGPHGIPVTVHPKREYKNKPEEPIQPQSTSFQEEESLKNENRTDPMDVAPIQSTEPCGVVNNLWTSKPPPLFHEGAPYPPPLFIRDTYNQSIPQPPPRKIKRLKKKIYREEPTSIMNAIKLRPRQVLCDKCKNVVTDKREVRKTGNDSFKLEEGKRRRHESVTTVNKKLKTDHKVNGKSQSESQKKSPVAKVSSLSHGRGKVVKVASQTNAPKAQLHTKKVLQSKNMDHAKAREVLKMAKEKAQRKQQKDASSSKNAHSKVHFTRRLQNTTSGTLPPRLRIKPQRYRNEENDSSLKIGLESLRSSKIGIKPQTRYTATRSAGEAPSEIKTPSNGPEEVSDAIQNTSVCVPPGEQDEQQALSKRGSKSNITVYMTLNQTKVDSSSASVCSSDSTDDLKSTHSECSSTENFDFPPGSMHAPSSSSSSSSKEEKKLSNSLKIKVFSKNVSKCVTPDGRTICVGDIVWAKIYGFPWWPARILTITVSRKDNGLLVRQEASISWFGSPTTSFLALSQLSPFLENFQSRFNKKRKGLYRKAITEAAKAAKQLTPEVRALLTQFET